LKRNGSDFSASIFAALLEAGSVTIWTDVDGVLSADPRRVPDALVIPELSYQEAAELAYFGAKVVHPNTMFPAIAKDIPIWIKNTFKPEASGTKISASSPSAMPVKGFATIDEMALLNVEGTGMIGIPGVPISSSAHYARGCFGRHDFAGEFRALDLFRGATRASGVGEKDCGRGLLRRDATGPDTDC
jgi:aspartate kinase